jgi:endonuclease-3 related protein
MDLHQIFKILHNQYGDQHWWPGDTPFEVMVGAVLTQNTAWINVERAIANLIAAGCLSAKKILDTANEKLAALLKPSGYFNVKATRLRNFCQWYVENGEYEKLQSWETMALREALLSINGIGPETADDILLYAFDRRVFVIDAYTRRLFLRLGLIAGDESYEDLRKLFENELPTDSKIYNEYHALIVWHSKQFCKVKPDCEVCCLRDRCVSVS